MYFPYLRGRQFELLALRELLEKSLLSDRILPIIEPVKLSSTLIKTLIAFTNSGNKLALVYNPQVGSFNTDAKKEDNAQQFAQLKELIRSQSVITSHYMNKKSEHQLVKWLEKGKDPSDIMVICMDADCLPTYSHFFSDTYPQYTLIPDESMFRREIHHNRVLMDDKFKKQNRNTDYAKKDDEVFSNDHLYYKLDGYIGFSDYSIIGDDYSETGFAPYAVAIHIVYFDDKKSLRVHHFVSETNDDISDPARKFSEAVGKLMEWNKTQQLDTFGIKAFTELYEKEAYPGLGTVKKLSLMHHIELMGRYLDEEHE